MDEIQSKTKRVPLDVPIPRPDGQTPEIIRIDVDAYTDAETGNNILTPKSVALVEKVRARHTGIMLPNELKALRDRLDLSQKEMSELLQIGEKSYTRWETGRLRPSRSMNLLLCALRDGRIDVNYSSALKRNLHDRGLPEDAAQERHTVFVSSSWPFNPLQYGGLLSHSEMGAPRELSTASIPEERCSHDHNETIPLINTINYGNILNILVDFCGLPQPIKRGGLEMVCFRIINVVANMHARIPNRCRLRLYGTWYENERLTSSAMELISAIEQNKNALVVPWKTDSNNGSSLVSIEMAYALEIDRQNSSLTHDVHRTTLFEVKGEQPQGRNRPKPLSSEEHDLHSALVDTMLTADLIFLSTRAPASLVVVSSHDSVWPGIRMALLSGARIVHIHTQPKENVPSTEANSLVSYKKTGLH